MTSNAETPRRRKKAETRKKILDIAARRLREQGLKGISIGPVMAEAGLTHGTFYAHFSSGDELAEQAFRHALGETQPGWVRQRAEDWSARLRRLARQYLTPHHRDGAGHGCPIGALASEASVAPDEFRAVFGESVQDTLRDICNGKMDKARETDAIVLLALCVGGINLARSVPDEKLSQRILRACRERVDGRV